MILTLIILNMKEAWGASSNNDYEARVLKTTSNSGVCCHRRWWWSCVIQWKIRCWREKKKVWLICDNYLLTPLTLI